MEFSSNRKTIDILPVRRYGSGQKKRWFKNPIQTPYTKVRVVDNDSVVPIQEIVVGPCTDKLRAVNAVQQLVKSHGQTDVTVVHSDIPYRTW